MTTSYSHTLRSLGADRGRPWLRAITASGLLLVGWAAWFALGVVPIHERSTRGWLEVDAASHAVESPLEGVLLTSNLQLGQTVAVGDLLFELDPVGAQLEREEARTERSNAGAELAGLDNERRTLQSKLAAYDQACEAQLAETGAQIDEAQTFLEHLENEAQRAEGLPPGTLSQDAVKDARAVANQAAAKVRTRQAARTRLASVQQVERLTLLADADAIERRALELEGRVHAADARLARLDDDITRHQVRAQVAGRLGEALPVSPGKVVQRGEQLAVIVPGGKARAAAHFPAATIGRIRPGQTARLQLDGFPWTRFGTLRATVTRVGNEATDGRVRVEFAIDRDSAPNVPIEHGLTCQVQVEVERVAPADLVLRGMGRWLNTPAAQTRARSQP